VDENLPNFFEALKIIDSKWYVEEDRYYQNNYAMDLIDDDLSGKLEVLKKASK